MSGPPTVDSRDRAALREDLRALAASYAPGWDADSADNATALLDVQSKFGAALRDRLNDVPEKHRHAFFDTLGFDRRPPRAARVPLTVETAPDADRNAAVPARTAARAEGDDGHQRFETTRAFEATPASLTAAYTVDPAGNRILGHTDALAGSESFDPVGGENRQAHVLYLGHDDLLHLGADATVTVLVDAAGTADQFRDGVQWEYYGADGEGTVGWHRLASADSPLDSSRSPDPGEGPVPLSFVLDGPPVETTVDGIESYWLRCRATASPDAFTTRVEGLRVRVTADEAGIEPTHAIANDVPLSVDAPGPVRPFGRGAQPPSTLFLESETAFSKPGAIVDVGFEPPADGPVTPSVEGGAGTGVLAGPPDLSWEYWDGDGWTRLSVVADETDSLRTPGRVRLRVPPDLEPTAVSGRSGAWIRARLVSGSYGPVADTAEPDGETAPRFGGITLSYEETAAPFEHVRRRDNAAWSGGGPDGSSLFRPLPDDESTLYLGFDEALSGGPLALFCVPRDGTISESSGPAIRWEYCSDPDTDSWASVSVQDTTAGLTERGVVWLTLPEPTTATDRFGERRHWLRARMTAEDGDEASLPVLSAVYPNTVWAENTRTITEETLGSGNGTPDQCVRCADTPVVDIEVWVEESGRLSTCEREALLTDRPDAIERVITDSGTLEAFWVRWSAVSTLTTSGPDDRHYAVDRTAGVIRFGDGQHGAVLPDGVDNVRATYRVSGGTDGNVSVGAISDLSASVPLVAGVTNPEPAEGGVDAESPSDATARASRQLSTRGKAVTARDFEAVAMAECRGLAGATCEVQRDSGGSPTVTLFVVPASDEDCPTPTGEQGKRVREAVDTRAPATLTADIAVRGPRYASVSVSVTVRTDAEQHVSGLESAIESVLAETLEPVDSEGDTNWGFDTVPRETALETAVASVDGVADVVDLSARVEVDGSDRPLSVGRRQPLPSGLLVSSGQHSVTITHSGGSHGT